MVMGWDGVVMEEGRAVPSGANDTDPLQAAALRARAGEPGAFEKLVSLTDLKIMGLAWRLLGDRDLARDAAQEVYLRIHRSFSSFRPSESFRAWMHRITVNVCFDLMRRRGPLTDSLNEIHEAVHAHGDHAEESLLLDQRRALMQGALRSLAPAERAALVLRDLEGLSTEEAARALGIRPATLRGQVSVARAKVQRICAKALRSKGGTP